MNILRLAYEYPPPWDGLASGIYEITQAQKKSGNRVEVFSAKKFPRALKRFSLFLTTAPAVLVGYLFYRLRNKVDIVHGHGHITCCFNLYKLFFGWLDKAPYVLHLHITAAGREVRAKEQGAGLDFWTKYFEWPLHKLSDRIGCQIADAVICTSASVRDEVIRYYRADQKKVFVVENGVNTQLFARPRKTLRVDEETLRVGELAEAKVQILYVGALNPRKNVDLLIKAVKFLPEDYRLTIVGRGSKEYEDQLHELVENLKIQDRVEFKGYIKYQNLPPLYQNATVFVLPSSYEGLPKVVLEALACGVPVLTSGFEMARVPGLHFLKEPNSKDLSDKIKETVEHGERVDVALVRQKYSWEVKAREIQEIYDRIRE